LLLPLLAIGCSNAPSADGVHPWPGHSWGTGNLIACSSDDGALTDLTVHLGAPPPAIPETAFDAQGGRIASDPARLGYLHDLQSSPRALACFAGNLAARADWSVSSDHPRAALIADAAASLGVALDAGDPFPELDAKTLAPFAALPPAMRATVARILAVATEAAWLRDRALDGLPLGRLFSEVGPVWLGWDFADASATPLFDPGRDTEVAALGPDKARLLYLGAARLAKALDETDWGALERLPPGFDLTVTTALGLVVVRGDGSDVYDAELDPRLAEPPVLVIDTGGDDVYRIPAGATLSADHRVSVHIDLRGNDRYGYSTRGASVAGLADQDAEGRYAGAGRGPFSLSRVGRQGSGTFGYGFLLDLGGGDDAYASLRMSQGFAAVGVGMLWDDGGSDTYDAEAGSQASALGGIGLLVDLGGRDRYRSFLMSQGFAATASSSLLYDANGDDRYELVADDVVLLGSSQTHGAVNLSLGQGAAMGWRDPDDARGLDLGGGVAILRDVEGADTYDGGTFAQGAGYWMGLGVLADGAGDDSYDAAFYGQGAAAHFAIAAFLEGGGNDQYNRRRTPIQSSLGLGHDFSMAVLVDAGGNDRYRAPAFGLGATTCRGAGVFIDASGDDEYELLAPSALGAAADTCGDSQPWPAWGLFLDADGADRYGSRGRNGATWADAAPSGMRWFAGGIDGRGLDVTAFDAAARQAPGVARGAKSP
jgi:hypothetical protein